MTAIPGAAFTEPATVADARAGDLRGITLDRPRVIVDVNLLLRDGDSILLGLRRGGFAAGRYSPPAGHLELGESVRDALIRETREEIGITIAPDSARFVQVMHNAYGVGRMAFFFEARTWAGDIANREPGQVRGAALVPARRPARGADGPLHPRSDRLLRRGKPSGTHSPRLVTPLPAGPCVIMKAGPHAGEDLDAIIARKQQESASAGWCLWGYGGSACHPLTQVQPHAKSALPRPVTVVFIETASTPAVNSSAACEYSANAREWVTVPEGHRITGSKYALVLRGLARTRQQIDLGACQVAVGPSAGKNLAAYLRGRCDKACAIPAGTPGPVTSALVIATAELAPPYSVFLRLAEPAQSATAAHRPSGSHAAARHGPLIPATGITGPPRLPSGPPGVLLAEADVPDTPFACRRP